MEPRVLLPRKLGFAMPKKAKITLEPPSPHALKVTKKQAAACQLATAIRLFFFEEDLVSALVLAGSAREVLRGLARSKGIASPFNEAIDVVKEEYQEAFLDIMNRSYNFMKHASRDPEGTYDRFSPDEVASVIFEACCLFEKIFKQNHLESNLFLQWMLQRNPRIARAEYRVELKRRSSLARPEMTFKEAVKECARFLRFADNSPDDAEMLFKARLLRTTYQVTVPSDFVSVLSQRK